MKLDVRKNAKRNMLFGVINKVVLTLLPFAIRSCIQYTLGSEYLGLNSLFSSILQALSVTEMGFSSAVIYHMYKPVAENDTEKVNALLNFYRKAYRGIGILILGLGVCLVPFLPNLISGSYPQEISLTLLFLIQLSNTVVSYFLFSYLSSLLVVYQRDDVNSKINLISHGIMNILQILVLIVSHNYVIYVLLMPVFTIATNLMVAAHVKKSYPQYRCVGNLSKDTLVNIKKLVLGTFFQKACRVSRNSLDSVCLSVFSGLVLTGIYNNYFYIFNSITIFLGIVATSLMGGVGNHVATKSIEENYAELKQIDFMYMFLSGWCAVCLLCLIQPFMKIWMGEKMLLPMPVVILMTIYFYGLKMGDMKTVYSSANGLWWQHRWRSLGETALNLILNVVLGKLFGVYGIVIATIISLMICNFFWATAIIFKNYFKGIKVREYFFYHLKYAIVTTIICGVTYMVCQMFHSSNMWLVLIVRGIICVFIPTMLYLLVYSRTEMLKKAFGILRG